MLFVSGEIAIIEVQIRNEDDNLTDANSVTLIYSTPLGNEVMLTNPDRVSLGTYRFEIDTANFLSGMYPIRVTSTGVVTAYESLFKILPSEFI